MGFKFGFDGKIYRLTSGTRAAWPDSGAPANLSEIANVKDVSLDIERRKADVSTRAGGGWALTVGTLKEAAIEFDMVWDDTDTHLTAIETAFMGGSNIALAVLDKDKETNGAKGLWADFQVVSFKKKEPLADAQMVSIRLEPAPSAVAPAWVKVVTTP